MARIRPNSNPNQPIPNTSFSSPLNLYVDGPYFPVVMGSGIDISTGEKVSNLNNQGVLDLSGATGDINLLAGIGISIVETTTATGTDFSITNDGVLQLIAGGNVTITGSNGIYTISASDAQTGTVTSVGTGVGLTGGPITTSGTISLDSSGVTPGSYTYADITVDAYGRLTAASSGVTPVTGITGTAPVQVTGSAPTLTVSVAASSTAAPGIVQLNDSLSSSSTTEALTANQGRILQDQVNALATASNLTFAGTIDASTGNLVSVTTEGAAIGFAIGSPLPASATGNEDYFVIVTTGGTMTPPGGSAQACDQGDWWLSSGSNWEFLNVGFDVATASTTVPGIVQLATDAEVQAGIESTHAVTSSALQSKVSDSVSTASSTSIASSQAVKDAYDAATAAQADATQALADAAAAGADVGDLSTLTTTDKSSAVAAINEVDANADQALADAAAAQVDATQALSDAAAAQATADLAIPCASITAKGDLLAGTAASTPIALSVGTNGQVLSANSACATGLEWVAGGTALPASGSDGQFLVTDTSAPEGLAWVNNPTSPAETATVSAVNPIVPSSGTALCGGYYAGSIDDAGTCVALIIAPKDIGQVRCSNGLQQDWLPTTISRSTTNGALITECFRCSVLTSGSFAFEYAYNLNACGYNDWYIPARCEMLTVVQQLGRNFTTVPAFQAGGSQVMDCNSYSTATEASTASVWTQSAVSCSLTTGQQLKNNGSDLRLIRREPLGNIASCTALSFPSAQGFDQLAVGCTITQSGSGASGVITALDPGTCTITVSSVTGTFTTGTAIPVSSGFIPFPTSTPTDSQVLAACAACDGGVTWVNADSGIDPSILTAKGDIIVAAAASTPSALPVGTNGQVLYANSACTTGLCWGAVPSVASATPTVEGIVFGCTLSDNTALGSDALASNTSLGNTAIGGCALTATTTGDNNVAVGNLALVANTTGVNNVGLGAYALCANTDGDFNVAVGRNSLCSLTTGSCNIGIGRTAGQNITTGCFNVAIGHQAQVASGSGSCQLAIGFSTTDNWLTGDSTKAIKPGAGIIDCAGSCGTAGQVLSSDGSNAIEWITPSGGGGSLAEATVAGTLYGWGNTDKGAVSLGFGAACCIGLRSYAGGSSDENIAIGIRPLSEQTGAFIQANVVIGDRALYGRTGDERIGCNIAIGAYALNRYCGRNLCHNIGIGYCTGGFWCNTGSTTGCTIAIGSFSGAPKYFSLAVGFCAIPGVGGDCNLAVGHCTGHSLATTAANNVMLGHCAGNTGTLGNICGSNNILIGRSANPSSPTVSGEVTIYNGSVSARFQGAASAWSFVSDERDKTNITALPVGLDFVNQLQPRQFEWAIRDTDADQGKPAAGFIAQEVDNVVESNDAQYLNLVDKSDPERYSLAQANIVPVLVKAIQELSDKVDSLQTELETLKANG